MNFNFSLKSLYRAPKKENAVHVEAKKKEEFVACESSKEERRVQYIFLQELYARSARKSSQSEHGFFACFCGSSFSRCHKDKKIDASMSAYGESMEISGKTAWRLTMQFH